MKKRLLKSFTVAGLLLLQSATPVKAQTVSSFDSLGLPTSYWNGSSQPSGTVFSNGHAIFPNYYDPSYGGYWANGWAYSDVQDSTTAGDANLYGARPAVGCNHSAKYIVGQQGAVINLDTAAIGKVISGFYITNGTYAALSMEYGDEFGKKFGSIYNADGQVDGTNGKDWFKLTIRSWFGGVMTNDSVEFYLADYRFSDTTQDYIVTTWQYVDLTSLGNADSLQFNLSSSDVGLYGMNTPAFFCIDNFTTQSDTSAFESLKLPASYWNGALQPLGAAFTDGNASFQNYYDTAYGGYWTGGWAYSNVQDSTTAGYTNLYGARPGMGYNNSYAYAVGQQDAVINLDSAAIGKVMNGFYVTNGTYPALSMKYGDEFGKKFGSIYDANGQVDGTNGKDWFKLTVRSWYGGVLTNDSVEFYLADYRFTDTTQDYIVTTWQWVDLTSLGNVDSLQFILSSSDVGMYGMNTPAFFCIDNFTTGDFGAAVENITTEKSSLTVFPNPTRDHVTIDISNLNDRDVKVNITDVAGKIIYSERSESSALISIDMNRYASGIYFLSITGKNTFVNQKLIKE